LDGVNYIVKYLLIKENYDYIGNSSTGSFIDFNCSYNNHFYSDLANTASAEPQLGQQLQLTTTASNTNNTTNGNNSMLISSPSSAPMNIRPNIQTDFNPNITYPRVSKFAYIDPLGLVIGDCGIGTLLFLKRLNDTFEENAENLIQANKMRKKRYVEEEEEQLVLKVSKPVTETKTMTEEEEEEKK